MNIFVTAIDTDAGKSVVTGLIARSRAKQGRRVITQKLVQTGCAGVSEDVRMHRRIMDIPWADVDESGDTCPYVFPLPASPHLSARLAGAEIDLDVLDSATGRLEAAYDDVIIEGVGGLCVPLVHDMECNGQALPDRKMAGRGQLLLVDYVASHAYPTVLVTSARLGSINHTLMSLEMMWSRGISVAGLVYNHFLDGDAAIVSDSRSIFERALQQAGHNAPVIDLPRTDGDEWPDIDFSDFFA